MPPVFKSKRNAVCLQDGIVVKKLKTPEAAKLESEFLSRLYDKGVPVPRAELVDPLTIHLEYIDSLTLPDYLDILEQNHGSGLLTAAADALAEWLVIFYGAINHNSTGEIRGDVNGRNFLYANGTFYGVDFEEHCYGAIEQDVGRIIAFVSTYTPPDTKIKKAFAARLNETLSRKVPLDASLVERHRVQELARMRVRRRYNNQ